LDKSRELCKSYGVNITATASDSPPTRTSTVSATLTTTGEVSGLAEDSNNKPNNVQKIGMIVGIIGAVAAVIGAAATVLIFLGQSKKGEDANGIAMESPRQQRIQYFARQQYFIQR